MGFGSWLGDKSKRKQLDNLLAALRNVFTSMLETGDLMPEGQALQVFQLNKERFVETVASESGGILKGPQLWPAFAVSMEAAEEALPEHLAPVARRIIAESYRRAADMWDWPPDRELGEIREHWRTFARLFAEQGLTEADAEQMVSRYSRFDADRTPIE
jgi:hypothetical protein